ncbi:MAG: hypothetical protein Q7W30_03190 [Coriobacteriia bacterium]|nr:hypothetical protein [Coriobacteriia bacterium]
MKGKFIAAAAVSTAIVAALAIPAVAAQYVPAATTVTLEAAPTAVRYGQDISLTPSIPVGTVVGDQIRVEVSNNASDWAMIGEPLAIEDTGTPFDPALVTVDGSFALPAQFRAIFLSKGKEGANNGTSTPVAITLIRNASTRVVLGTPSRLRHGRSAAIGFTVLPDSGAGVVTYRLYRNGRLLQASHVHTNELGAASKAFRFTRRGTYRVQATFAGNIYGAKSRTAVKSFRVR